MICPQCKKEEKTSSVVDLGVACTLLGYKPYYDKEGKHHVHNPNRQDQAFRCSNGHLIQRSFYKPCPSCDYGQGQEWISVL